MRTGQQVRIRPASPLARRFQLNARDCGVVLCQYSVLARGTRAPERLDVRLPSGLIAWGVPADAFEAIEDASQIQKAS